ncbi:MAG: sugar ABC transporter permease [Thaumarchaeota archaeon]|nr:sugar ABC transporter permease [Nitrososphaerota archaeon]
MYQKKMRKTGLYFVLPELLLLLFLVLYPATFSFTITFLHWNLKRPDKIGQFAGLDNYIEVINSPLFQVGLLNSFVFAFATITFTMLISLAFALILNESFKGKPILQAFLLIPWAIPGVANAVMWKWIYDSNFGLLNNILFALGLIKDYLPFLSDPSLARFSVINAFIYRSVPLATVILLAALQAVPKDLLEAAEIDGAGAVRKFFSVVWPYMRTYFFVALVLITLDAFRVFDIIYVLTFGGPGNATTLLSWLVYVFSFQLLDFSQGCIVAYIIVAITALLAMLYSKIFRGEEL